MAVEQIMRIVVFGMIGIIFLSPIKRKVNSYYPLEKSSTDRMKGIACIMVILGHASYQLDGKGIFSFTTGFAFVALSVFFFVSGYGLMHSLINKENYLAHFFKKRILLVLLPFWSSNIIFYIYNIIKGERYGILNSIERIIGIKLFVGHNWYVQVIVLFYIIFYLVARFIKKQKNIVIVFLIINIIILFLSQIGIPYIPQNACCSSTFFIGILFAYDKTIMYKVLSIKLVYRIIIALIGLIEYSYIYIIRFHYADNIVLQKIGEFTIPVLFLVLVIIFVSSYEFGSKVFNIICICSYEIFLMHQIAIDIGKAACTYSSIALVIIFILIIPIGGILYYWNAILKRLIQRITK